MEEVKHLLEDLLQDGAIAIDKDIANPTRSPFDAGSKKRWDQKTKANPLSGKGKSYADRVEGPDGWGQHVPVTRDDDDYDLLF
ncbi:hypothetical protein [Roseovarius Plymouth podovirus 1]|uniref:Uncharacterized protein n=2 Tax=Roseovarius Plymouth podovirus 1 TaxID=926474 RepID=K4Q519_9CAUD|nr:hypothetical protein HYO70_gp20 [Roseovarius Plymouth podovirus 1]CBW47013.1 hypothetical protein [Roseovarius sp. 217 phage 1]CBX87950.1 hypothetical protein [Roseovarius Plymouth podovirus 1]